MTLTRRFYFFLAVFTICTITGKAQDAPIGYWDSHLPYNTAVGLATDGNTVYAICNQAFFTYNTLNGEYTRYSKIDGMSDIGMQCVAYDMATATAVLVYTNGNIDLLNNNTFYNIPELKLEQTPNQKVVNGIYVDNGLAYLSTSLGILVIDLAKHTVYKTIEVTDPSQYNTEKLPVTAFTRAGNFYYIATSQGLFRADKNTLFLPNTAAWLKIDSTHGFTDIANVQNTLFFLSSQKLFTIAADTFRTVFTSSHSINHIDAGDGRLYIGVWAASGGAVKVMNTACQLIDSFDCADSTVQAVQLLDESVWVASPLRGLKKRTGANLTDYFVPDGPTSPFSFDIYASNRNLYIAHGGYNSLLFSFCSVDGFSYFHDNKWTYYKKKKYAPFDTTAMRDFVAFAADEHDGTLYAGSYLDGLFALKADGSYQIISQNSIFDGSIAYGSTVHQVIGLTFDQDDNLWLSEMFAKGQLYVKTRDNNWYKFTVPGINYGGPLAVDDQGQVWVASFSGGVAVYDAAGTPGDTSDDKSHTLTAGAGFGNLPDNGVNCLAKDKDNKIWIGTASGIAVVSNCRSPFNNTSLCEAVIPVVTYKQTTGTLFAGKNVRTIAVDGVNRKWIGTDDGVWLLSADGQQVISRFTADNSPLPSDHIQKIAIDKVTGDIYFGTEQGLVSYHGSATEGGTGKQDVLIFPNPAPAGYTGNIAIRGLTTNADVRITDIDGQLVYKTKALGGQAIWNGKDYTGRRASSGVYLVFITNSNGSQTYVGKMVFIQ